jgi:sec-independent protein translocase protein TatA
MFEGLLQPAHLLLIVAIAMILFGPKKLPELGKGMGEAIRGFRDAFHAPPERQIEEVKPQPQPQPDQPKPAE